MIYALDGTFYGWDGTIYVKAGGDVRFCGVGEKSPQPLWITPLADFGQKTGVKYGT